MKYLNKTWNTGKKKKKPKEEENNKIFFCDPEATTVSQTGHGHGSDLRILTDESS